MWLYIKNKIIKFFSRNNIFYLKHNVFFFSPSSMQMPYAFIVSIPPHFNNFAEGRKMGGGVGGEEFFWRERVMGKSGSSFGVCFRVFRDTNYKINTTTFI